tara:strand:- start:75 stop:272 length:198 start_codon:yes stop_codon:yes gene_type:complete
MSKSNNEIEPFGECKKLTLDLSEELASQHYKLARNLGVDPEVLAAAILTSHIEKGSLDTSDLRDS